MSCPFKVGDLVVTEVGKAAEIIAAPGDELYDRRCFASPEAGVVLRFRDGSEGWRRWRTLKAWEPNE